MTTPNHHEPIAHLPQPNTDENKETPPAIAEWVTTTDDGSAKCVVRLGRPEPPKTTT